ncbi:GntR family transcriptional regulator [Histidinibacterium lentulum]|uniref:GntR family transcriptional regulator n=1 Tax=Histidinibacterium lentulum TaxID=2480588 RepID=A0A3N2R6K8_9RHOB|nr:GntR family transcriptional regulator [Histidinibacterium lentulum]ROU03033.1 GntR family transcriptional regulator [Histidinibacterium lentulum]
MAEDLIARIGAALAEVSPSDRRPIYRRLSDLLARELRQGPAGTRLPSERRLARELGISRVTVRRALDELSAEGLVLRRRGARSAAAVRLEKRLSSLTGFSDELRNRGMRPGQRWLSRQVVLPAPSEALALDLAPAEKIARLERVRLADGHPIAIERAAVPLAYLPDPGLVGDSLYAILAEGGTPPVRGAQRIRAGLMSGRDAELLDSRPGAPLLIVERRCFLADGRPVEFTETRYDGESYDFLTELQPQNGTYQSEMA